MKTTVFSAAVLAVFPILAMAGTTNVDVSKLPGKPVHDTATVTPLALSQNGSPSVILLSVAAGKEVPAHATEAGLRLITVVSGNLYWGDGDKIDPANETVYPAGSFLMLPSGVPHWLAARDGDLVLQLVVLDGETPVPAIAEQMK
ncbi:MAG: cupin domain-containing protein [Rhodobacteraceae bacterium]|nr:cupin domain-containing protein [Paracoccaceae bacterium]